MKQLLTLLATALIWLASFLPLQAQEDDGKGFLTRTIQDALSGAGRQVSIDGFEGLLSSSASFERLTIADAEGVWLTIEGAELVWNRSALLRGRLEVEKLTAQRLDLPRLPQAEAELPEAEAAPFQLPDLPVSIEIAEFGVQEINLGAPLLGEAAQLSLAASATYTEDLLDLDISAERTDAKRGAFEIRANLERADNLLDLLVRLDEGPEGIAARLLNLPDQPPVELLVEGAGPLDDFTSQVRIATDGQERLSGEVILASQAPRRASDTPDRRIRADIGGDITALLAPRYREFFGEDLRLTLDALQEGNGALEVSSFALDAQAAALSGRLALNPEGWPTLIDIEGSIANPDGTSILLPVGGEGTRVGRVGLDVDYAAAEGEALRARFDIAELTTSAATAERLELSLDGTLSGTPGSLGQFQGDVALAAQGLAPTDPALAEALGRDLQGRAEVTYVEGEPIRIAGLELEGRDYGLAGEATVEGLETGFATNLDATLRAEELSRFSALAGREIDGAAALTVKGDLVPLGGQFDLVIAGLTEGLRVGIEQADALLSGRTELELAARRDETGTFVERLTLGNEEISLEARADLRTDDSRVEADLRLTDVSTVLPQYEGPITVEALATQDASGWSIDASTDGPYGAAITAKGQVTGVAPRLDFTAAVPDISRFAEGVPGSARLEGTVTQVEGDWRITTQASGPYDLSAQLSGALTPALDLTFEAEVPQIQPLVPQVSGPLAASGRLQQTAQGFLVDVSARGPYEARATAEGLATGPDVALDFTLSLPDVAPLAPGLSGPLAAEGQVRQTPDGLALDLTADGPYGASLSTQGTVTGPALALTYDLAIPNVQPLAPGISGPLRATGSLRQGQSGLIVETSASGPYASRATVSGTVTGPQAAVEYSLSMPDIGPLVERINGPLDLRGSARRAGSAWQIDASAQGPAGTQVRAAGRVAENGTLDLDLNGNAPLGLARPFIAPRSLTGQATFDLSINGPPALSSVSGTIRASGATFSAPNLRLALRGISAEVALGGNRARIDLSGEATNGGRVAAQGAITLTPSLPAEISIGLRELVLIDPRLYRTSLNGDLRLAGPLAGGAVISGNIAVGETEISVPSTGLTTIGEIPQITHLNPPPEAIRTRQKAGLVGAEAGTDPAAEGGGGPGYGLNIGISAPGRIFVRGRGLDAELGGRLTLTGTTNRIISSGRFDLQRGRLDILGKRFNLVEGSAQFQGDLVPFIRFVTATPTAQGEVRVIVEGPADSPEVRFEATPDAPQDEVLAQLLFGRNLSDISAFQALQLASAVATLAGRGGDGIVSNLREGFGLDDFDVTTTDEGETALRVGKYLSDNLYTDVTAASDGTGEVSLNLDITPNLRGKATLGSDGDSGIGIFYERDY